MVFTRRIEITTRNDGRMVDFDSREEKKNQRTTSYGEGSEVLIDHHYIQP